MMRFVRAYFWMRSRLLLHSLKGSGRRDTLEQVSRFLARFIPLVFLLLLLPTIVGLGAFGLYLGLVVGRARTLHLLDGTFSLVMRAAIATFMLMVTLAPLVRAGRGKDSGLTRFLLLPVRRSTLFLTETLGALSDPWLLLLLPLILFFPVGLLVEHSAAAAVTGLAAGAGLLAALIGLNACCSFVLALLFRNRRRGEWLTVIFMSLLTVAFPIAGVMLDRLEHHQEPPTSPPVKNERPADLKVNARFDAAMPVWTRAIPSEMYVSALASGVEGRHRSSVISLSGLAIWSAALIGIAGWAYRRMIETPDTNISRRAATREMRLGRIPGLTLRTSAIAMAGVRQGLRTVRGKLAVYLAFPILGVILLLLTNSSALELPGAFLGLSLGQLAALFGFTFSLLSIQPILFNLFAIDKAGLTLQLLVPVTARELVRGKIVAGGLLAAIATMLCAVVSVIIAPGGNLWTWAALAPTCVAAYLWLGPGAATVSALLPKDSDLSRLGKPGNPHALAGLIGVLLTLLATALAQGPLIAGLLMGNPTVAFLLSVLWLGVAAVTSLPLQRLAESTLARRQENLLIVALGK